MSKKNNANQKYSIDFFRLVYKSIFFNASRLRQNKVPIKTKYLKNKQVEKTATQTIYSSPESAQNYFQHT